MEPPVTDQEAPGSILPFEKLYDVCVLRPTLVGPFIDCAKLLAVPKAMTAIRIIKVSLIGRNQGWGVTVSIRKTKSKFGFPLKLS